MFIVSPKWIYLENKKVERNKSILVDGTLIIDILSNDIIDKKYKNVSRLYYDNHIMIPSFCECYLNVDDCENENQYNEKISRILSNGVTRIQVVSQDYKKVLEYNYNNLIINHMISLDAKNCTQSHIRDMLSTLDFYKSDISKTFSLNLHNILDFDDELLQKISSIANELNLNIHIHLNDISNLEEEEVKEIYSYWDDINLLNNCSLHDVLTNNYKNLKYFNKKNIVIMIEYHELNTSEYIQNFILLSKKKYKCVLVSNKEQSYKFYNILKVMEYYTNQLNDKFDSTNIIACVTSNAHRIFTDDSYSYSIRKGSLSSFNLYNCNSNNFLSTYDVIPRISCLDNTSLGDVWSSGQKLKEFDE